MAQTPTNESFRCLEYWLNAYLLTIHFGRKGMDFEAISGSIRRIPLGAALGSIY